MVNRNSSYFCANCYYLIEATAQESTEAEVLLLVSGSLIGLKEGKSIRETLEDHSKARYSYSGASKFRLAMTSMSGTPFVTVTLSADPTFKQTFNVNVTQ